MELMEWSEQVYKPRGPGTGMHKKQSKKERRMSTTSSKAVSTVRGQEEGYPEKETGEHGGEANGGECF